MSKKEEPRIETSRTESKRVDEFGAEMYSESAKALRQVGTRVILSVGAAILIWIFGQMLFIPIAEGMTQTFWDYPVHSIVSLIIAIALAIIIFTVFIDIRRLSGGIAGILAYHFGKVTGEVGVENFKNYRTALDGILYVIVVALAYLLFADYLGNIHAAIPAVLLVLIVVWSIFALWRSSRAVASAIGRYTSQMADELEKQSKSA